TTIALDLTGLPGASALAYGTDALLMGLSASARAFSSVPWASVPVTAQEVAVALLCAFASIRLLMTPWRVAAGVRIWLAISGGAAGVLGLRVVADLAAWNSMEITAIDVGQGDAVAIRTPRNRWYLIDGGPRSATFDAGASRVVPYLQRRGVRRLEAVVLSHPDADHVGGLAAVLESFPVGAVLGPGRTAGQVAHLDALAEARKARIPWRRVVTGDTWTRDGVSFEVLHPGADDLGDHPNDWSVVILSRFGEFEALFMGDAEEAVEGRVLAGLETGGVDVLKVGHHGSRTSTSPALLDRASPRVALISAGRRNRYGHPDPRVIRRLQESGVTILRTDASGTVSVTGRRDGSLKTRGPVPRESGR
ncbi:MAG: MBL fold metallo-hydrolase, partial [Gemmatimonadota bacterium]|nr:MBL fold metallo-hydrolase [Gemmatimonadota bacterium]